MMYTVNLKSVFEYTPGANKYCLILFYKVPGIVKFTESESTLVDAGAGGGRAGEAERGVGV